MTPLKKMAIWGGGGKWVSRSIPKFLFIFFIHPYLSFYRIRISTRMEALSWKIAHILAQCEVLTCMTWRRSRRHRCQHSGIRQWVVRHTSHHSGRCSSGEWRLVAQDGKVAPSALHTSCSTAGQGPAPRRGLPAEQTHGSNS